LTRLISNSRNRFPIVILSWLDLKLLTSYLMSLKPPCFLNPQSAADIIEMLFGVDGKSASDNHFNQLLRLPLDCQRLPLTLNQVIEQAESMQEDASKLAEGLSTMITRRPVFSEVLPWHFVFIDNWLDEPLRSIEGNIVVNRMKTLKP